MFLLSWKILTFYDLCNLKCYICLIHLNNTMVFKRKFCLVPKKLDCLNFLPWLLIQRLRAKIHICFLHNNVPFLTCQCFFITFRNHFHIERLKQGKSLFQLVYNMYLQSINTAIERKVRSKFLSIATRLSRTVSWLSLVMHIKSRSWKLWRYVGRKLAGPITPNPFTC